MSRTAKKKQPARCRAKVPVVQLFREDPLERGMWRWYSLISLALLLGGALAQKLQPLVNWLIRP